MLSLTQHHPKVAAMLKVPLPTPDVEDGRGQEEGVLPQQEQERMRGEGGILWARAYYGGDQRWRAQRQLVREGFGGVVSRKCECLLRGRALLNTRVICHAITRVLRLVRKCVLRRHYPPSPHISVSFSTQNPDK